MVIFSPRSLLKLPQGTFWIFYIRRQNKSIILHNDKNSRGIKLCRTPGLIGTFIDSATVNTFNLRIEFPRCSRFMRLFLRLGGWIHVFLRTKWFSVISGIICFSADRFKNGLKFSGQIRISDEPLSLSILKYEIINLQNSTYLSHSVSIYMYLYNVPHLHSEISPARTCFCP